MVTGKASPIDTAPRDGSLINVLAGLDQLPVKAHWSKTAQGWMDNELRVLHLVSKWIPPPKVAKR